MSINACVRSSTGPLLVLFSILVSGCVGSNVLIDEKYTAQPEDKFRLEVVNETKMAAAELKVLSDALDRGLASRNMTGTDANRVLQVTVTKYHFRSDTTRVLTGNLTGNDAIVSTVRITRSDDGKLLGKEDVITHNPTVISKSQDLIKTHATKILSSLAK